MDNQPQRPNNYLALAIISTIACCMPLGVVSIIYSTKVNTAYDAGDFAKAESSSKSAKTWGIAGVATGVIGILIYAAIMIFYAASEGFDGL